MAFPPLMNSESRLPLSFTKGAGCWLFDEKGQRFFDTTSALGTTNLGHAHPVIAHALALQAAELIHCSNQYYSVQQRQLAERLCQASGLESVFLCNSGDEANECAIKIARIHGKKRGIEAPAILVMDKAFHGYTLATLSASGIRGVQVGFEPLVSGFIRAPFNDIQAITQIARANRNIAAVLVEPVQSEAGVIPAAPLYFQSLKTLCERLGWLLMIDEGQTGNGRCGSYFAYQDYGIVPDVVTTGGSLANGVPMGACLAGAGAANCLAPGQHGTLTGGNALACSAALASVDFILANHLGERALDLGERILQDLRHELGGNHYIRDIRGRGLLIGIEMMEPCGEIAPLAYTQGLLVNVTAEKVIRLMPPINLTDGEAAELVRNLVRLIRLYAGDDRKKPRHS
ncbi:MAG: aminotransferase class III-fold pyridoxal phosphate-dependent enzyme [Hahellaceae bacterium]|jgi:acetylornithine/N-succinyldiaminopimelate aminotransferase|nr:aminotransferase class III-fold pyridoxal phosphate-dependent enzyme [Hahellaceae bacterium]